MPRPLCPFLCALLLAGSVATVPAAADQPSQKASAPAAGVRDLDLGREAVARQDYAAAIPALRRAVAALDPQRDRAAFADAWLHLGLAHLLATQSDPEQALAAFLASAAAAPNPASAYLWAGTAAERLGRSEEAETFKARALAGPVPPAQVAPEPAAPAEPPAPAPLPAPVEARPSAAPEPAPARALPEPAASQPAPTLPEPAPAPAVPPSAPSAAPAEAPSAAPAEGEAFRHFFGRREPKPAPPPTQTKTAPPPPADGKKPEAETPAAEGAGDGETGDDQEEGGRGPGEARPAEPASGAAFDHFFRRRRGSREGTASQPRAGEAQAPAEAAEEKPPAT